MNIPKSYEALAADLASEKILSKTLLGQKEAYMMLADQLKLDLATWKQKAFEAAEREAALREELDALEEEFDTLEHTNITIKLSLAVAEQREVELKRLLCDVINEAPTGFAALKVDLANRVQDAFKPAADHTQCEECKGWGYHENHYEGGGTECGECGGSGNASVAVVMPERLNTEGGYSLEAETWYNLALDDVARLNGVTK